MPPLWAALTPASGTPVSLCLAAPWFPSLITRDTSTFVTQQCVQTWSGRASWSGISNHAAKTGSRCCCFWSACWLQQWQAAAGTQGTKRCRAMVWGRPWGTTSSLPLIPSGEIERQVQSIWQVSIYYEHIQKTHNRSPPPPLAASLHVGKQKMLS